jgi:hypothetical protein
MIKENPLWGAQILHGELIKLGIRRDCLNQLCLTKNI